MGCIDHIYVIEANGMGNLMDVIAYIIYISL